MLVLWAGLDGWRAEAASVDLTDAGIRARGTQTGADPLPYRLDYRLDAAADFVTRSLEVDVTGEGWTRRIDLRRGDGAWSCHAKADGDVVLPPPGGDVAPLAPALDCDLGLSPLTNLMPVRRHALNEREGDADLLMAWVSVPDLAVHASPQRYEHVRPGLVRFVDRGLHDGFVAELELDPQGLVLLYPGLARRVTGSASPGS